MILGNLLHFVFVGVFQRKGIREFFNEKSFLWLKLKMCFKSLLFVDFR